MAGKSSHLAGISSNEKLPTTVLVEDFGDDEALLGLPPPPRQTSFAIAMAMAKFQALFEISEPKFLASALVQDMR